MGKPPLPVHFLHRSKPACGVRTFKRGSRDYTKVTCANCRRSIPLADAEARSLINKGR